MENQPREAKKKSVGSNTKGRGSQPSRGGSSGASAQPQPPFGYTSQPPFFYQQPSHPSFYNTQPQLHFGYFQNLLSMDPQAPAFDPFAFRSPQVPSPRENVERPLPINEDDDEDDEVVPETQNLGDYEDDTGDAEYNVNEDADNEVDDARGKKAKMERQNWTKYQEEALAKAWVHCSTNKNKGNQQTRDGFWRRILDHYNATVGGSNRTVHQVRSKWNPMMTKINFFNGLYQQADRTRESGCSDLNVMKIALKDFQDRYPSGFQHIEAWEVIRKHDKWAQVPLSGEEGEGSAQKRKPIDVDPSIPDMNEDPSPQRTQRRDKRQATSSEGSAELAAQFKEYTAMKEAKHAIELRKKRESEARELITEQRETMRNYAYDRDMKTFLKPHDDAPPEMLPFILARKRDIANKFGWPCNF
ncbi:putative glutathione transferase transcription factor MYB family [Helianthus annuus]|uniref:Glutathione transferase transcription factor MYB family n=1 Tax=Helianthus annuus TaxID=4232 RepID=A0A9K3MY13_HELAN|nr:putative glutathione transferase transcription factor MYB family [Helianthus annuus]